MTSLLAKIPRERSLLLLLVPVLALAAVFGASRLDRSLDSSPTRAESERAADAAPDDPADLAAPAPDGSDTFDETAGVDSTGAAASPGTSGSGGSTTGGGVPAWLDDDQTQVAGVSQFQDPSPTGPTEAPSTPTTTTPGAATTVPPTTVSPTTVPPTTVPPTTAPVVTTPPTTPTSTAPTTTVPGGPGPSPVVDESPVTVLLPVSAIVVTGLAGLVLLRRRSSSARAAT